MKRHFLKLVAAAFIGQIVLSSCQGALEDDITDWFELYAEEPNASGLPSDSSGEPDASGTPSSSGDNNGTGSSGGGSSKNLSASLLIGTWKLSVGSYINQNITFEEKRYSTEDMEGEWCGYEIIGNCIILDAFIMIKVSKCTTNKIMGDHYRWDHEEYYRNGGSLYDEPEDARDLGRTEWKRLSSVTLTRK